MDFSRFLKFQNVANIGSVCTDQAIPSPCRTISTVFFIIIFVVNQCLLITTSYPQEVDNLWITLFNCVYFFEIMSKIQLKY